MAHTTSIIVMTLGIRRSDSGGGCRDGDVSGCHAKYAPTKAQQLRRKPLRGLKTREAERWFELESTPSSNIQRNTNNPPPCLDAIKPLPGMEKDLRTEENYREESIDKASSEDKRKAWGELTTYGLMSY